MQVIVGLIQDRMLTARLKMPNCVVSQTKRLKLNIVESVSISTNGIFSVQEIESISSINFSYLWYFSTFIETIRESGKSFSKVGINNFSFFIILLLSLTFSWQEKFRIIINSVFQGG